MNLLSLPVRRLARGKHSVFIFHKTPKVANPLTPAELELSAFETLLDFIAEHFKVVPLEETAANTSSKRWTDPLASLTFDDGYPDWLSGVAPALLKRQLPATFFITTGQFSGEPLWHERIIHAITHCAEPSIRLNCLAGKTEEYPLGNLADKQNAILRIETLAKYLPLAHRQEALAELEKASNSPIDSLPIFKADDVRQLHNLGFGIGAHTVNHPILTRCDIDVAKHEIGAARETLNQLTAGPIHGFAYPNGIAGKDFSAEHVELVKQAGYRFAVTTDPGVASQRVSPYLLPRFTPWGKSQSTISYQVGRNLLTRATRLESSHSTTKRALMIAFHFPPQAGSSGVQRTLNFVKHLPKSHWQPIVLTAVKSAYESTQEGLLKSVPESTQVIRSFAFDTARHLSIAGKYLRLMAVPDRWITWVFGGITTGIAAIRHHRPNLIWSTYPLATANLIAVALARIHHLPWIADFRDPMIVNDTYPSDPLERWTKKRIEAMTMRCATRCIFTTEHAAQLHRNRYPFASEKCIVIPNGFDNDAFCNSTPSRFGVPGDKLLLLHSGLIYPKERDPTTFFQALAKLIDEGLLQRDKICIRFRGPVHDKLMAEIAAKFGIEDVIDIAPPIPYREAISEMSGADMLLVFQGTQFNPQVPAKIYEYLRAGPKVLGIVDHQGNAAAELRKFPGTALADINDSNEIATVLLHAINELSHETQKRHNAENHEQLFKYSREAQTTQLAKLFDSIIGWQKATATSITKQ